MSLEYLEQTNLAYRLVGALHILGRSRTGETRMACGPGNFEMSTNPMMRTADENRFQLGIDRDRSDPEVRGNDIGQRDQPVHGGVVLMVVGIAGLVISLVWPAPPGARTLCITRQAGTTWIRRRVTTHASDGVDWLFRL